MQDPSKPIWFKTETNDFTTKLKDPEIKIYVATPVHSEVSMHYTQALLKFQQACMMNGILVSFALLKSSLVTQGRNLCVANYLNDPIKYTHLLFIDSDIDFTFSTISKMLSFDKEVVSCVYPMKHIHWEQIWERLQQGKIKTEEELSRAGFIYPVKMENLIKEDTKEITVRDGFIEVSHAPTGCMLIKRQVFDKMIKSYPDLKIDQDTIVNGEAKKHPFMYNFFDTIHDPETKKYYGEDFGFCRKWTAIGGKCYCYIDDLISHVGEYQYKGKLKDNLEFVKTVDDSNKTK